MKIPIPTKEGYLLLHACDILFCEADGNYSKIHRADENVILVSKTLAILEAQLAQYEFCRIHKSYLINMLHIEKYMRGDGGYVKMSCGTTLSVSRSKKGNLISFIQQLIKGKKQACSDVAISKQLDITHSSQRLKLNNGR